MNSAVRLLDIAASRFGEKAAFEDEHQALSFTAMRRRALSVATALLGGREPVVVYLPKCVDALVCFMGAMYAGRPYVPVDAAIPMSRLRRITQNLRPSHIITGAELIGNLAELNESAIASVLFSELVDTKADEKALYAALDRVIDTDPIYVMYTSGSTGSPKGVTVAHRGVIDYARWVVETFGFDEETVMANQAPFYFDNSIFDIYGTLLCGGRTTLIPERLLLFPGKLPEFLKEKDVTSIFWVPTVMINVANSGALDGMELPKLKTVAFCGEIMPNRQLNIWRKRLPGRVYANLYGPTEITDVCCYYIVDREFNDIDPLPIGRACRNTRAVILREDNTEAKTGEAGELCIIGTGVALGYWGAKEITDKVFVQNPLGKKYAEPMYRTGDLAYFNDEGLIMFIGRSDSQIKLKGNRIELGEIENAAKCLPDATNAKALFDSEKQEIVLFLETAGELRLRQVNMELKKFIPGYMLPGRLVTMPSLPHTANDKIDGVRLRREYIEGAAT